MKLVWVKSESTVIPQDIDHTSSPTTIYLHKNITQIERDGQTIYQYDEAKLSKFDYQAYCDEKIQSNLAYVAMMADIDLESEEDDE